MQFNLEPTRYSGFYRGRVLSTDDSTKSGRIKVEVFGVFVGIKVEDLPWAIRAESIFTGAGNGYGSFNVPEVGSFVWCFFEHSDFNQPVYFASAPDGVHGIPSESSTNYPDRKVWKTKAGIVVYIDDSKPEIKVEHPGGASLLIDSNGNISIIGLEVTITGNIVNINP